MKRKRAGILIYNEHTHMVDSEDFYVDGEVQYATVWKTQVSECTLPPVEKHAFNCMFCDGQKLALGKHAGKIALLLYATYGAQFEQIEVAYEDNCVPVAGVNLLLYWHERKFFDLVYGTWQNTYYKLYSYFGTGPMGTSNMKNVKNGLDKYLFEKGVQTGVTHYWDCNNTSWHEMKYRLDFGEPFIYVVSDNCIYKNHAVLALGYVEYKYSSVQFYTESKYSRYLCLADGWTPYADRYVNIDVGNAISQDEMITLYFVGK